MSSQGVAKVPFGPTTAAAIVLSLMICTLVAYFVIAALTVAVGWLPDDLIAGTFRQSRYVKIFAAMIGAAAGGFAGVWVARVVCDFAFAAYLPRAVFYALTVLAAAGLAKLWQAGSLAESAVVLAQVAATLVAAFIWFWPERSPVAIGKGIVGPD
ncbi:hypothetical protein EDC40_104274 [Aminobacter aminovorans]|uniref:Uncharacterized protein n=1 Tax=Aminobacter aminovorans TaxID=83263 RepID=A0A380WH87_AMIAI|nr:hypothetical protein [Aminobacter aminovorans]TCS26806.1 hypothetical protein EDC40_104274 [Aminobacter aminovorans]SUU88135.1 Uncharacterised protein [Aminobacter aminovorans]